MVSLLNCFNISPKMLKLAKRNKDLIVQEESLVFATLDRPTLKVRRMLPAVLPKPAIFYQSTGQQIQDLFIRA